MRCAAVLLGIALLAGCSGSSHSSARPPGPTSTVPTSTTPTSTVPTASAASTTAASSPPTSATVQRCHAQDLLLAVADVRGAAGTIFAAVRFTNRTAVACGIYGWPGVGLLDAKGAALPARAVRGGGQVPSSSPSQITLQPGAVASFTLSWSDVPGSGGQAECPQAATLLVTPPDERASLHVALSAAPCRGELDVSAVVAGAGGAPR